MKRITALDPTARPQDTCLLTLVTQDGRRHTKHDKTSGLRLT